MSDYSSIVAAGIKFLDANYTGDWRKKVETDALDLASCDVCVLGQIFGSYDTGKDVLDIDTAEAKKYGFNTDYNFTELTAAWKAALGKDNVLVERGDVYTDAPGCCAVKVVGTQQISVDGEPVMLYLCQSGEILDGKFKAYDEATVFARQRRDFGEGAQHPKKFTEFTFKKGQFITNSTGKVWYVVSNGINGSARLVADQNSLTFNSAISRDALREVRTSSGQLFSDTIAL